MLRREGKKYSLNLYEIYWSDNTYYLIGAHDHYDRLTSYRLDRIENLEISQSDAIDAVEKIGPNPELIIRKYIEESVNHFLGETVRIEVEYKPEPATNAILYDFVGKNVVSCFPIRIHVSCLGCHHMTKSASTSLTCKIQ